MCRTALTNSAEGRSIGEQFNHAILLMIAAPYLVMGTVGAVVFRRPLSAALRARRRRRAAVPVPSAGR